MKKLTWHTEKRKVSELKPADYNPRKLSDKARADLTHSVEEFGEVEPVVVNTNGTIIGGHQRISVYADLKLDEITVRVPDRKLTPSEEKRLNLRLNKNLGEWDFSILKSFDMNMLLEVGFDEGELMTNFGLDTAEGADVDDDRIQVLSILPPESPKLRERAAIHFDDLKDYEKVKKAVDVGEITAEKILKLL